MTEDMVREEGLSDQLRQLERKRKQILTEISKLGDMRRGTLLERYLPCGKPGCHCTMPHSRGHGPNYSLTCKVEGKTVTEYIPKDLVPQVQKQTDNHRKFRSLSKFLLEVNEEICNIRLKRDRGKGAREPSSKELRKSARGKSEES
jgi:hypothetical protein